MKSRDVSCPICFFGKEIFVRYQRQLSIVLGHAVMKSTAIIRSARNVLGSLRVPGDKSISHRYAMLAALASGRSRFENFAPGADCSSTLECVRNLGCTVVRDAQGTVTLDGPGP